MAIKKISIAEWEQEGVRRFGKDKRQWVFRCPSCGSTQTYQDFLDAGLTEEKADGVFYFSCLGRWDDRYGCNYTSGGLLNITPQRVITSEGNEVSVFEFADKHDKLPYGHAFRLKSKHE